MNVDVWLRVDELAAAWKKSDIVQEFVAEIPGNGPKTKVMRSLESIEAGLSALSSLPLSPEVWRLMAQASGVGVGSELEQYFQSVGPVGRAAQISLAWIRSRVPGLPEKYAPQLAPGAPLVSREIGKRIPWIDGVEAQCRMQSTPYQVGSLLGLRNNVGVDRITSGLGRALSKSDKWIRYEKTCSVLTDSDRSELLKARGRVSERLSPKNVNLHESSLAHRRNLFREEQTSEVISELIGPAYDYALAFSELDDFIYLVVIKVLGELIVRDGIKDIGTVDDLEILPGPNAIGINFRSNSFIPRMGQVVWIDDPLVSDAVIIRGMNMSWNETNSITDVRADVLLGTGQAWRS